MHGKFPKYFDKDHVDVELSFKWMKQSSQQHRIRH